MRTTPPRWMADSSSDFCPRCAQSFWLLRRRHHCRGCGEIFCDACASARVAMPHIGFAEPVRACSACAVSGLTLALLEEPTSSEHG